MALAAAERTQTGEEPDDSEGLLSPMSSASGAGALAPKFDGAHLFAGHEGAVVPARQQARGARKGLEDLQSRLDASEARARLREAELEDARAAAEAELEDTRAAAAAAADLANARADVESELAREHAALKQERERATELEGRVAFLELELESSARGNDVAVRLREQVRALERELSDTAGEAERVRTEAGAETVAWATERATWTAERSRFEQEEARWTQLAEGIETERTRWEQEREELTVQAKDQIAAAADGLRALVQRFDVPLFSRESGLGVLVDALRRHLEKQMQSAQEFELLFAAEAEKRAAMSSELETAQGEIQALRSRSSVSVSVLRFFFHRWGPPWEGQRMLRRLPHAEQPSRVHAAPHGTAARLFNRLCEGRRGLRGDPAAALGDASVSRSARRTAQRRHTALPRRQWADVAQLACGYPRQPRPVDQRHGRARAQESLYAWRGQHQHQRQRCLRHGAQLGPGHTWLATIARGRRRGPGPGHV